MTPAMDTVHLHHQGNERRPLLVIDDFWPDPEMLREDAAALRLGEIGPHYPGVRAEVPARLAETMRRKIAPLLATHFGFDPAPGVSEAYYSLVTTPPAALAPIQRLPHFDGVEPRRIALLLFLGHGAQGGTAPDAARRPREQRRLAPARSQSSNRNRLSVRRPASGSALSTTSGGRCAQWSVLPG